MMPLTSKEEGAAAVVVTAAIVVVATATQALELPDPAGQVVPVVHALHAVLTV